MCYIYLSKSKFKSFQMSQVVGISLKSLLNYNFEKYNSLIFFLQGVEAG